MTTGVLVPETPRPGESRRAAWLVILTFAVAMAAAWWLKSGVEARSTKFATGDGALRLAYPAGWVTTQPTGDELLDVFDPDAGSALRPRFSVVSRPAPAGATPSVVAATQALRRSQSLREYRELGRAAVTVAAWPAVRVTYGYVTDPPGGAGQATLPIVVQATDWLVLKDGRLYTLTAQSEAAGAAACQAAFDRILGSVAFK